MITTDGQRTSQPRLPSALISLLSEPVQLLPQLLVLHLALLVVAAAQGGVSVAVSSGRVAQGRCPLPFLPLLPPSLPPLSLQVGGDGGAVRVRLLPLGGLGLGHREAPHFPVAAPLALDLLLGRGGLGRLSHWSHLEVKNGRAGIKWSPRLSFYKCLSEKGSCAPHLKSAFTGHWWIQWHVFLFLC